MIGPEANITGTLGHINVTGSALNGATQGRRLMRQNGFLVAFVVCATLLLPRSVAAQTPAAIPPITELQVPIPKSAAALGFRHLPCPADFFKAAKVSFSAK